MILENLKKVLNNIPSHVTLVAVSKTKPNTLIMEAYQAGQRVFGENKVQEMVDKANKLPTDIQWHMIGHLQRNKVKYIAPFVSLIHGIDSLKLLKEVDKRAAQNHRIIDCLLQVHIAKEQSKFGFNSQEIEDVLAYIHSLKYVRVIGLMGMATNTTDKALVKQEFNGLNKLYTSLKAKHPDFKTISMGMSGDYLLAISEGSTMVRIGSSIFGSR